VEVDVHDAEPLAVPKAPLQVVEERPDEVAANVGALRHCLGHRGDVRAEVVDAQRVVDDAALGH
jgi:hypothetical protein